MSAVTTNPLVALAPQEEQSFRGVVVYEDNRTRDRALHLYDDMERKFWPEIDFDFSWWRFDYLRDPDLFLAATAAAARADWVIFSAHGGLELPPAVRKWIQSWSSRKVNSTSAIVALIGVANDPLPGLTPIHNYLRQIAQQAGMDYFPQVLEASPARREFSVSEITLRAGKVTAVLDGIIHRPTIPSRWGINE